MSYRSDDTTRRTPGGAGAPTVPPATAVAEGVAVINGAAPVAVESAGDDVAMAGAWGRDARELLHGGEIVRAIAAAMRAIAILRTACSPEHLSAVLVVAAEAQAEAGNLDTALQLATESVDVAQASGDGRTLALAFRALGELHGLLGQLNEGARLLGQALKVSAPDDDGQARAHILDALCRNTVRQADREIWAGGTPAEELLEDAVEHGRRGLEAARRVRDPRAEAACGASLALALLRRGDLEGSLHFLRDAGALATTHRLRLLQHRVAAIEGEALLAHGETREAVVQLRELAAACELAGEPLIEIDARRVLYRAAKALDEFEFALLTHERYHLLDTRIRTEVAQARARVLINEVETQNAKLEAEKARLEAELLRLKSRRLESEKRALEAQARELDRHAHQDALTGLWNRRYIDDELPRLLSESRLRGAPLVVAIGDIDLFKTINDRYGHPTGDAVLCMVADLLRDNCRPSDTVARVGGEEFLLVLEDTDPKAARPVCERLRRSIEKAAWSEIAPELNVTISFGISDAPDDGEARDLLATADAHLYAAKRGGRNRVEPRAR